MKLLKRLPKEEYDKLIVACDIEIIFLNYRFAIPNFPSRLLNYMQTKLPVLAVTDSNTDIGKIIVDGGFGWWCESCDVEGFKEILKKSSNVRPAVAGRKASGCLENYYSTYIAYRIIHHLLEKTYEENEKK